MTGKSPELRIPDKKFVASSPIFPNGVKRFSMAALSMGDSQRSEKRANVLKNIFASCIPSVEESRVPFGWIGLEDIDQDKDKI